MNTEETRATDTLPGTVPHTANSILPLDKLPESIYPTERLAGYLQLYLCAAIIANLGLLFWDSNGDMGFWQDWIKQLANKGYQDFNGNYPPLYIHWLYIAGQLYNYLQMSVENDLFLKFLSQIPIMLSHLALIGIVYSLLKRYSNNTWHFHACMALTALNPALFFNGPIWGQIDVMPLIPALLAILASTHARYRLLTFPFYTLALLTKFQMIAFAPLMGIIFFRHYKIHLVGCLLSLAVIAIAFLPSMMAGHFSQAFRLAYIDVLHQYGATTMGAANIWILLTGNAAPDQIILFGIDPDSPLAIIFKAKNFGMLSFFLVCLAVFLQGMGKLIEDKLPATNPYNAAQLFFYAMICTAAFFTLLPAMHERYLLPAVIVSLVYYALSPGKIIYPIVFSFVSAFNLAMCMGLKTSSVWPAISWIMFFAFCYALLELLLGKHWHRVVTKVVIYVSGFKYLALVVLILGITYMGIRFYGETYPYKPELANDQLLLTSLPIATSRQDYGQMNINRSVNGNVLRSGNQVYAYGIGTHANSVIEYDLLGNIKRLQVQVGLDDEVESANVVFSIWGDDRKLWESRPQYGAGPAEAADVDLTGVRRLQLRVDSAGDIGGDHADWLNPILTRDPHAPTTAQSAQP